MAKVVIAPALKELNKILLALDKGKVPTRRKSRKTRLQRKAAAKS